MTDFDIEHSRAVKPYFYRAPAPADMHPHPYQDAAVEYALRRNHCLVGDAPGLGKSAESILLSNAIKAQYTLIICPASLILNWEREVWMWNTLPLSYGGQGAGLTYAVKKSKDGISDRHNYVILSYDMLRSKPIIDGILAETWDHLILDEAHFVKDPRGNQRTKAVCAPDMLPSVCGRITALTGTPSPNQPIELYNLCRLLDWDCIDRASVEDFRDKYYEYGEGFVRGRVFDTEKQAYVYKLHYSNAVRNKPTNLADLQYRLRKHIMVRRLKDEVLTQLPPKQWHPFPLMTDAGIREALRHPGWADAERLYEMDPDAFDTSIPVDGAISTARRVMGEAKVPAVASYIDDLMQSGVTKLVVATWHKSVIADLTERLAKKYKLVVMDGGMSTTKKQAVVDRFQFEESVQIIIGQMRVLGLGWTLTQAQDVVFAESSYVPGENDQMLDRIHRMGQKGNCVIGHIPVVPRSLEEKIIAASIGKSIHIHKALDA